MIQIDVLLGLVIVFAIMAMLGWILVLRFRRLVGSHVGPEITEGQSILVAVDGSDESARAVELACRLAADKHARVILTHVIEVPLRYTLDASLPQLEERAKRILESAALLVKESRLKYESRVMRDRTKAGGLVTLARDTGASMVVVGFDGSLQSGLHDLSVVSDLFRHTPCEVLIAREPIGSGQDRLRMGRLIEPSIHA